MCVWLNSSLSPGFTSHQAVARTAGNVLLRLADSLLLPLSVSDYAETLEAYLATAVELHQGSAAPPDISNGGSAQRTAERGVIEYRAMYPTLYPNTTRQLTVPGGGVMGT